MVVKFKIEVVANNVQSCSFGTQGSRQSRKISFCAATGATKFIVVVGHIVCGENLTQARFIETCKMRYKRRIPQPIRNFSPHFGESCCGIGIVPRKSVNAGEGVVIRRRADKAIKSIRPTPSRTNTAPTLQTLALFPFAVSKSIAVKSKLFIIFHNFLCVI